MAQSKSSNAKIGPSMAFLHHDGGAGHRTDDGTVTVEAPRVDWDGLSDAHGQ